MGAKKKSPGPMLLCLLVKAKSLLRETTITMLTPMVHLRSLNTSQVWRMINVLMLIDNVPG